MYDIKPLEKKWKRYRKKKRKTLYIFIFYIFIIVTVVFSIFNYKNVILSKFVNNKSIEGKKEIIKKSVVEKLPNDNNVEIETDDPMQYEHPNAKKISIIVTDPIKKPVRVVKSRKKIHLNIIQTTSVGAYKDVENRFVNTSNTDDSLFLARTYYERGDNKKAIYWALETNKVNANIDESWLIFAKAKARSGYKSEAIRILSSYVKRSGSFEAKVLLKKLKNNFK